MPDEPARPSSTKRILITGMHRSGTSFFTSWLHSCGMSVGDELIGATPSNPRGHWEDRPFVELFELLLRFNDTNLFYSGDEALAYSDAQRAVLEKLVEERDSKRAEWSVKQCRAALFLDMWLRVVPDSFFLFILRDPLAVINSLLKRESGKFLYRASRSVGPDLEEAFLGDRAHFAEKYARAYLRTYRAIQAFVEEHDGDRFLLIPFERLTDVARPVFQTLTQAWGFELQWSDMGRLYDPGLVTTKREYLLESNAPLEQALETYRTLSRRSIGAEA